MELAIDTSTNIAGIALAREGLVLSEMTWRAQQSHTTQLMPAIETVLRQAGIKPSSLTGIGVAVGPGGFSALRAGLSVAKGLAMSLGIPVAGMSTLLVEAYPFLWPGLPVRAMLDAGRGVLATAVFSRESGRVVSTPEALSTIEQVISQTSGPTLFCGEHLPVVREQLSAALGGHALFPPGSMLMRRPGNLAELAWQRLSQGRLEDAATLQPAYLRPPSITPARTVLPQGKRRG